MNEKTKLNTGAQHEDRSKLPKTPGIIVLDTNAKVDAAVRAVAAARVEAIGGVAVEEIDIDATPSNKKPEGRRAQAHAAQYAGDRVLTLLEKLGVKADADPTATKKTPQTSKSAKRAMLKQKRKDHVRERLHRVHPCGNPGCIACYGLPEAVKAQILARERRVRAWARAR